MSAKLLAVGSLGLVFALAPATVSAQAVRVYAGRPGAYEVHEYLHRPNSFDRPPYFATNPPVYYGEQRYGRTYGWTPYPYLGTQYRQPPVPLSDKEDADPAPARSKDGKDRRRSKSK